MSTRNMRIISTIILALVMGLPQGYGQDKLLTTSSDGQLTLTRQGASHFATLALRCMQKEFPNKSGHVNNSADDVRRPKEMHPAFYGCFDWHSSVHGHWMLVKLLRKFPDMPEAGEIRRKLSENLTPENIKAEVAYFRGPNTKSFERTYGWAWLLKLAAELHTWDDPEAKKWSANLQPLTEVIVDRYLAFLPKFTYPNRTGEHPNTAFGLAFAWDYADVAANHELKTLIEKRASDYYLDDQDCPSLWEPGGSDFLSPCLEEADIMRRVLGGDKFEGWFSKFLPRKALDPLYTPAEVSDRSDPKIVHLDGLNLSRAWCFKGIAKTVENRKLKTSLVHAANEHLRATVVHIASGGYEGEHWLASFAIYALME